MLVLKAGSSSAGSLSTNMKIIVIRNNCDKSGSHAQFFGLNPHSNKTFQ